MSDSIRLSTLFTKTRKDAPKDETARNAQLLIRAGFIYKEMAGVYAFLPLGLRVLENIKQIVREEMNAVKGQELIMTNLQRPEVWQSTSRWSDDVVDIWFKTRLKDETELGLAWSHEEPIMQLLSQYTQSYKDLPATVYQFQTKLRNELRAKSGIMRGREFVMKDMYSVHANGEDLDAYYNQVIEAYRRVYSRLGLGDDTYVTFASGGAFTKFSHEFQTICDAGEDILYVNREKNIAVNEEVLEDAIKELGISKDDLEKVKSAEVGNIFNFGTEKAEQMGIQFTDQDGTLKPLYLASYGIGVTRVMGVIAEKFADDKGLVWPESVAPARVYLVSLANDESVTTAADKLYEDLQTAGISVLYDDREGRAGAKFADADLIGCPVRITISARTLENDSVEYKLRTEDEAEVVALDEVIAKLS